MPAPRRVLSCCWSSVPSGSGLMRTAAADSACALQARQNAGGGTLRVQVEGTVAGRAELGRRGRFRLGVFDPPARLPWARLGPRDVGTAASAALALEAGQKGARQGRPCRAHGWPCGPRPQAGAA